MYAGMPVHIYMGGCQEFMVPFGPYYNTAPTISALTTGQSRRGSKYRGDQHIGYSKHHWPRVFLDITREGENGNGSSEHVLLPFRDSFAARRWYPGKYFFGYLFIIFSSFCIFVPLPLAAPGTRHHYCLSFFLHFSFVSRSLGPGGCWHASSFCFHFFHVFFIFPSFALEVRWPKGREGGGQNAEPFHFIFIFSSFYFHFFFICVIIFSSFLRCRSPRSSFFLHFVSFSWRSSQKSSFFFILFPPSLIRRGRGRERRCRTMRK